MSAIIQREVEATLQRLQKSIFDCLKQDHPEVDADEYDLELEKFAKNTVKKIFATKDFKDIEKKTTSSAKKEKRDPDAPKAAKNSFIFFCSEKRSEVKEENPGMKPSDITKKLGKMWREMDDEDKEEFQDKAKEDKERFNDEMGDYEPTDGFKCPKKSPKKESLSPKRGRSSYIFFCSNKRQEVTDKLVSEGKKKTEVLKKLGEMWRELDEDDKEPYEKLAKKDKKRYENEMKAFNPVENDDDDDNESDESDDETKPAEKKSPKKSPKKSSKNDEEKTEKKSSKKTKKSAKKPTKKSAKKSKVVESDDSDDESLFE